jgi:hypothetical protein
MRGTLAGCALETTWNGTATGTPNQYSLDQSCALALRSTACLHGVLVVTNTAFFTPAVLCA